MTKVCHITCVHGGNDIRIFHKECTSLTRAGYEVYQVAPGAPCEQNGVHIVGIGDTPASRWKRMTAFAHKAYRAARELDCDIYHIHDPELLPYALKLKRQGKKVIFDSHESILTYVAEKDWVPAIVRKPAASAFQQYLSRSLPCFDALISVTPHICDQLRKHNARVYQIANYPLLTEFYSATSSEKRNTICFAGGISAQWSHIEILRAMRSIDNLGYILCGAGSPAYMKLLQQEPAWNRVEYHGFVSRDDVANAYAVSKIGVALLKPSLNTDGTNGTIGNTKLFEYMMAGIPVICTNFSLWQDIMGNHHCGICVDPADPQAIADAIAYLLAHPEEARQMGENGRRAVLAEYNWGVEERKLLALYKELEGESNERV